jgi:hypothetical protein
VPGKAFGHNNPGISHIGTEISVHDIYALCDTPITQFAGILGGFGSLPA